MGYKIGIISVLIIVVISVIALKNVDREEGGTTNRLSQVSETAKPSSVQEKAVEEQVVEEKSVVPEKPAALPKLLDLGAGKCIPCKMMEPILEELTREYKGRMDVQFVDVWKDQAAGEAHGIRMIPTQIFFDAEGRELFRHEGYYSKEEILNKWKELGVDFPQEE